MCGLLRDSNRFRLEIRFEAICGVYVYRGALCRYFDLLKGQQGSLSWVISTMEFGDLDFYEIISSKKCVESS